ncbi:M1 family metallopeptidase [Paenibacillus assamensis]|uniref:M1 family metallopeptidase n=1 Tax=Paenibacillus assamensis TaxID=311244 RepID=UPI000414F2F2|nr:M1 family metallopeptidase [Paenibacillus assamensis]
MKNKQSNRFIRMAAGLLSVTLAAQFLMTPSFAGAAASNQAVKNAQAVTLPADHKVNLVEDGQRTSPIQYTINLQLDEKQMKLSGTQSVLFRNETKDDLSELVFHTFADSYRSVDTQTSMFQGRNKDIAKAYPDKKPEDFLGGIDVQRVMDKSNDGKLSFENKNQSLTVKLGKTIKPGEEVIVELDYTIDIPFGMQRMAHYKDLISAVHFYPILAMYDEGKHEWNRLPYSKTLESDYFEASDYKVSLNVPSKYKISMPGQLQETPAGSGRKVITATADKTREFVFFASPDYKVKSKNVNGIHIEMYYFGDSKEKEKVAERYVEQAAKAIEFFGKNFGAYPYKDFRIMETYVEGVAIEYTRVIQMGQISDQQAVEDDSVFIHEIAHQWFHAIIGNNSETEAFLDEGLTHFATSYFYEEQKDDMQGFNGMRMASEPLDKAIASNNEEAGDEAHPLYYERGRLAVYELYRKVGQPTFDRIMQEYYNRYALRNAAITDWLQTIGDIAGADIQKHMRKALYEPNFDISDEYKLTPEEEQRLMGLMMKSTYDQIFEGNSNLPQEVFARMYHRAYNGEPVTIVLSDGVTKRAMEQQKQLAEQIQTLMQMGGAEAEIVTERSLVKKQLEKELSKSHIIAIGSSGRNPVIQALKPGIQKGAKAIQLDWNKAMQQKDTSGVYMVKHPYHKDRLLMHMYWTSEQVNAKAWPIMLQTIMKTSNFSSDFYQWFQMNGQGKVTAEKSQDNPISKLFE